MSPHFVKVSEKSNGRIKSYKAKSVVLDDLGLFGGIFDPFWAPGDASRVFPKKFLQCKTTYENTFCRKISGKSNGRFTGNKPDGRTDARTDETDNYSPFPTKVGGLTLASSSKSAVNSQQGQANCHEAF